MNIILLSKNYENYIGAYYQHDWVDAFDRVENCFIYGPGYPEYNPADTIDDVIAKSPFSKGNIDLVVCSPSWDEDTRTDTVDPHPAIDMSGLDIPKFYFMNKEYKKLDLRFEYIRKQGFDFVGSVLWDRLEEWEKETGIPFVHTPFGINPRRFADFGLKKKWDFGFTGQLHRTHTDLRTRVKQRLFRADRMGQLSNRGLPRLLRGDPLRPEFKKYRIFWAEFGARNLRLRSMLPKGRQYAEFLNTFKVFLNTPSAMGIINTRFYELMAARTMILCPQSPHYGDFLKDGENCLMFRDDASDFADKLKIAIEDNELRTRIARKAHQNIDQHTYEFYVKRMLGQILDHG